MGVDMSDPESPAALPGDDVVRKGIEDLERGDETVESLLVSIGAPRLVGMGIAVGAPIASPEHRLYGLLATEYSDEAHARYNALIRRLVSFERAVECAS
jgi:hypothetical protein